MPEEIFDKEIREAEEAAFEIARTGIDIERFISSPIGKYLLEKAEREYGEATTDLVNTPIGDSSEMADAQLKARVAIKFKLWLIEGVNSGLAAEKQLRMNDEIEQ